MKGSKWTWLRDKCLELGYIKAAELAQEIEDRLYSLYGATTTEEWERVTESEIEVEFSNDPNDIICSSTFCRGCEETHRTKLFCHDCKFGKETGVCDKKNSLFLLFYNMFELEERYKRRGERT